MKQLSSSELNSMSIEKHELTKEQLQAIFDGYFLSVVYFLIMSAMAIEHRWLSVYLQVECILCFTPSSSVTNCWVHFLILRRFSSVTISQMHEKITFTISLA